MATTLVYAVADFQPFTKIVSADVNSRFNDIKNRFNWDGTAATGLGDDNVQSNSVSGGGLTRSSKLKAGTANAFIINAPSTGLMTELSAGNSKIITTDGSGVPTAITILPASQGGTGQNFTPTTPDDVIKVNQAGNAFELGAPPTPSGNKIFLVRNFA